MNSHFSSNVNLSALSFKIKTGCSWNAALPTRPPSKFLLNLLLSTWPLDTILEFRCGEHSGFGFTLKAAPHEQLTLCVFLFTFLFVCLFLLCKNSTQIVSGFRPGMFISSLYWWQRRHYLGAGARPFGSGIQICWAPFIARHCASMTRQCWGGRKKTSWSS